MDNILQLCIETISAGHSVLIFCPTKKWCEKLAQQVAAAFFKIGTLETSSTILYFFSCKACQSITAKNIYFICLLHPIGCGNTMIGEILKKEINSELIHETLEQLKRSPSGLDNILKNVISFGVAFHHAGLTMDERDIIEGSFR